MKPPVVIIHGWNGSPKGHWQHSLAESLRSEGWNIHFPVLPQADRPDLELWIEQLHHIISSVEQPPVLISHSLGAVLCLHYLHRFPASRLARLLLVAPPGPEAEADPIQSFFPVPVSRSIHNSCPDITLICSRADPFCPTGADVIYGHPLGIKSIVLHDAAAHINIAAGFGPWPLAKSWVEQSGC